jgi:hypothetical protein
MSASCASLVASTKYINRVDSPFYSLALTATVLFPVFVVFCIATFLSLRRSSTFLRKRNVPMLLISSLGTFTLWSTTVLYDAVGGQHFPCALFGLIYYMAGPLFGGPILVKVRFFKPFHASFDFFNFFAGVFKYFYVFF